mmetsp:Transcript_51309/g.164792  ORF Transcript_51309/g.164792 Transcript_51309/m.164792 type:complete len:278 (+) Transcript_51309:558-1391(+)
MQHLRAHRRALRARVQEEQRRALAAVPQQRVARLGGGKHRRERGARGQGRQRGRVEQPDGLTVDVQQEKVAAAALERRQRGGGGGGEREGEGRRGNLAGGGFDGGCFGVLERHPLGACHQREGGLLLGRRREERLHVRLALPRPVRLVRQRAERRKRLAERLAAGRVEHLVAHAGGVGHPTGERPLALQREQQVARRPLVQQRRDRSLEQRGHRHRGQRLAELKGLVADVDLQPADGSTAAGPLQLRLKLVRDAEGGGVHLWNASAAAAAAWLSPPA